MKYDNEYYLLKESGSALSYILGKTEDSDEGLRRLLSLRSIKQQVIGKGKVQVIEGNKNKFFPCDYHFAEGILVSKKLKNIIMQFNPVGVDFYQADILNQKTTWADHYYMHIWNNYRAMHKERSKIDGTYVDDDFILESLSLDENVLDKILLKDRFIFILNETPKRVFHETVVNVIKSNNLTGIDFIKIKDWNICSAFDDD